MDKVYFFIVTAVLIFSKSSPREVDIRRIGSEIGRILTTMESLDPSKLCSNDTSCRKSEKCILDLCRNPCRTECGLNAVCNVVNHEPQCRCPKCHDGDALIKCTPYEGLRERICVWDKLIRKINETVAHIPKHTQKMNKCT